MLGATLNPALLTMDHAPEPLPALVRKLCGVAPAQVMPPPATAVWAAGVPLLARVLGVNAALLCTLLPAIAQWTLTAALVVRPVMGKVCGVPAAAMVRTTAAPLAISVAASAGAAVAAGKIRLLMLPVVSDVTPIVACVGPVAAPLGPVMTGATGAPTKFHTWPKNAEVAVVNACSVTFGAAPGFVNVSACRSLMKPSNCLVVPPLPLMVDAVPSVAHKPATRFPVALAMAGAEPTAAPTTDTGPVIGAEVADTTSLAQ